MGALSFSLALYLRVPALISSRTARPVAEPYRDRRIAQADAEAALQALETLMVNEGAYKDPT